MNRPTCRLDHMEFPTSDAGLVAWVSELAVIRDHLVRIQGLELSLDGASPDLAIMVWERIRAMLQASWRDAREDMAVLQERADVCGLAATGVHELPLPSQLDGDPVALARLGQLCGRLQVFLCLTVARIRCGAPTTVLPYVRAALDQYVSQLDAAILGRAAELVSQWHATQGVGFELFVVCVRPESAHLLVRAAIGRPL